MEPVNRHTQSIELVPTSHCAMDATEDVYVRKLSENLQADINDVNSGGVANVLTLPVTFYGELQVIYKAIRNFDGEAVIESSARLFNIPIGFAYAIENITISLLLLQNITRVFLNTLALITGRVFVAFEVFLESSRFYHLLRFKRELNLGNISDYKNDTYRLYQKLISIRNTYFQLSEAELADVAKKFAQKTYTQHTAQYDQALQGKLNSLSRKIRPWLVKEIQKDISEIITGIRLNDTEAISRGVELLGKIKTQIDKTQKVYAIGLVALAIAMVIFGLTIAAAPHIMFVLLILGVVGTALEFGRSFAPASYLDQKDHKWHWDPWIPTFLKRKAPMPSQNPRQPMIELVTSKG